MNPPPLPPHLPPPLPGQSDQNPRRALTGGRIAGLIFAGIMALAAAIRSGNLTFLPLFLSITIVPLFWLDRLINGLRRGVISSRIRTGSRTTSLVSFTFTGPPDIYHRKHMPIRFWLTWLVEGVLFLCITPFFWVVIIGPIIEGGPH